jgi:hypothetical protein
MSVSIKSPDAGTTVSGNPLSVVLHYNSTERLLLKSKTKRIDSLKQSKRFTQAQQASNAPAAILPYWKLTCTVEGTHGTPGNWHQFYTVPATGDPGADRPFEFYDDDGPIPDGEYQIIGALFFVIPLGGGLAIEIEFGTDVHSPVEVDT